jgi:hypothetical protein
VPLGAGAGRLEHPPARHLHLAGPDRRRSHAARRRVRGAGSGAGDWGTWEYTDHADEALAQLDAAYDAWSAGVTGLGEEGLARAVGSAEGPWAESPYADLVLHINRELIHHGAEICLLRDLYRVRSLSTQESR